MSGRSPHSGSPEAQAPRVSLDRRVLLGTLTLALCLFAATWIAAADFLPGAKLFPDVLAGLGAAVTLIALARVWRGIEPGVSPGQAVQEEGDVADVYRKALLCLGFAAIYYVGIFLFGFLPATGVLLVGVARGYGLSWRYAIVSLAVGLGAVWVLSTTLNLYLPLGWIIERIVGG